jgi:hypothetical protein
VELAQNAADAASRAGVPGRLLLRLTGSTDGRMLVAANTGTPLDAAGVEALSTLRASAKRDEAALTVGRFGVGFAAVLAGTDEPAIGSRTTGSVRWSRTATRAECAAVPELASELSRRGGHVPVLRLPFATQPFPVPDGYDTAVGLPLRDDDAEALIRRLLSGVDAALLLALPALAEVAIEVDGVVRKLEASWEQDGSVTVTDAGVPTRWLVVSAGGDVDPALLADRPTEERARPSWSVVWALPVEPSAASTPLDAVVHAPTPTDEPLELPALLVATFPLDSARRRIPPGPLRDFVIERAAQAYAEVVCRAPVGLAPALVPRGLPGGEVDALLRRAILARLPETPFLPGGLRPRDAVAVDPPDADLLDVLQPVLPGLLSPAWSRDRAALDVLGVRRLELADVVDLLGELDRSPAWWRQVYDACAGLATADREALTALPVPLTDGRTVRGARGAFLPAPGLDAAATVLGLRVVHPDAVHPLLERIGAAPGTARGLLQDPAVRAAVEVSEESEAQAAIRDAVLTLVTAADLDQGELPWLGQLAMSDGFTAADHVLPDSPLRPLLEDGALEVVPAALMQRWGRPALVAIGVLDRFTVLRAADVVLDEGSIDPGLTDLADVEEWIADVAASVRHGGDVPPVLAELAAVRDLDLVRADAWPQALALLTADSLLRDAVTTPARVQLADGRRADVLPYTTWWLRHHAEVDGRRLGDLCVHDADEVVRALYDPVPLDLDSELLRALGIRRSLAELLAEPGGAEEILDRLGDPDRHVSRSVLRLAYLGLAELEPDRVRPPSRVRALVGGSVRVVPASAALVVDRPDLLPLLADHPVLLVPVSLAEPLADVLSVSLASEVVPGQVESLSARRPVPAVVREVLPGAPREWMEHEDLVVDDRSIEWRVVADLVHASTLSGLARGLALAAGEWHRRYLVAEVLADPDAAAMLRDEQDLDER